jgi:hypothetical protein
MRPFIALLLFAALVSVAPSAQADSQSSQQEPANTSPPTVSGDAVVGATLKADPGDWVGNPVPTFTYAWQYQDATGGWPTITGADQPTYTPSAKDVGRVLRVDVTGTNSVGSAAQASAPTAPVTANGGTPVNTTAPTITGSAEVGKVFVADPGSWTGTPAPTFKYQWQRDAGNDGSWVPIQGATADKYTPAAADVNAYVRVEVTASNAVGAASADSNRVGPITGSGTAPVNTDRPSVSGTPAVGDTLEADPGKWDGDPAPTFTYAWQRDPGSGWVPIAGAAGQHYTVVQADVKAQLRVDVTATNTVGSATADSQAVGPVPDAGTSPDNTSPPTISGVPEVGETLTADPGEWDGNPSPTFAYRWEQNDGTGWAVISGATSKTYTVSSDDIGTNLRVRVTGTNPSGSETANSRSVGPVTDAKPTNTRLPEINGTVEVDETITADPGSWTGSPMSYGYQWQRKGSDDISFSDISGATAKTYDIGAGDLGALLRVTVTATNDAGRSDPATSQQAGPVAREQCHVGTDVDTDGDKVPDCTELAGFTLQLDLNGTGVYTKRAVKSDPKNTDTDGDKVGDGDEWAGSSSDPSLADSDHDELSDYVERLYLSAPTSVDSDGDALIPGSDERTEARLFDGNELNGYSFGGRTISTSPILADTDGDGMSDYLEIAEGGFNPLVADLPRAAVQVPADVTTGIQVFTTITSTNEKKTYASSLTASEDVEKTHSVDLTTKKTINTFSDTLDAGFKAGLEKGKPTAYVYADNQSTWEKGTITNQETGSTSTSIETTRQEFERYRSDTQTTQSTLNPQGTISTAVEFANTGKVSYTLKDLEVIAFQRDPRNPQGQGVPIATLALPDDVQKDGVTLGPEQAAGPYQVTNAAVSSQTLLDLMANPGSIVYEISGFSLLDAEGKDFASTIGQKVNAQTASVTIDDGTPNGSKTYLVATNVARTSTGEGAGVSMRAVLKSILDIEYKTCPLNDGTTVLCEVDGLATKGTATDGAWAVIGPAATAPKDFDDLTINQGDSVQLLYVADSDADQLWDPLEAFYGTDPTQPDTEGDGLTDYAETRAGWKVPYPSKAAEYQVYSNPLSSDGDADGSPEYCKADDTQPCSGQYPSEHARLTDPNNPDTNSNGIVDGADPNPLQPVSPPISSATWPGKELQHWGTAVPSYDDMWMPMPPNLGLIPTVWTPQQSVLPGYYKVTWTATPWLGNPPPRSVPAAPLGIFTAATGTRPRNSDQGGTTEVLRVYYEAEEIDWQNAPVPSNPNAGRPMELYLHLPVRVDNLTFALTQPNSAQQSDVDLNWRVEKVTLSPITQQDFLTGPASPNFVGLGIPGSAVTAADGVTPSGQVSMRLDGVKAAPGESFAPVTWGPGLALPAGGYRAAVGMRASNVTANDAAVALIGASQGPDEPRAELSASGQTSSQFEPSAGMCPQPTPEQDGCPTGGRVPLAFGAVWRQDLAPANATSWINLLFAQRGETGQVGVPIAVATRAFEDPGTLWLDGITIDRVPRIVRTMNRHETPWSGAGWSGWGLYDQTDPGQSEPEIQHPWAGGQGDGQGWQVHQGPGTGDYNEVGTVELRTDSRTVRWATVVDCSSWTQGTTGIAFTQIENGGRQPLQQQKCSGADTVPHLNYYDSSKVTSDRLWAGPSQQATQNPVPTTTFLQLMVANRPAPPAPPLPGP